MTINATIVNLALFFQQLGLISSSEPMMPISVSQTGQTAKLVFPDSALESSGFIVDALTNASQGAVCSTVQIV